MGLAFSASAIPHLHPNREAGPRGRAAMNMEQCGDPDSNRDSRESKTRGETGPWLTGVAA